MFSLSHIMSRTSVRHLVIKRLTQAVSFRQRSIYGDYIAGVDQLNGFMVTLGTDGRAWLPYFAYY